jgi:hypothetical protein
MPVKSICMHRAEEFKYQLVEVNIMVKEAV